MSKASAKIRKRNVRPKKDKIGLDSVLEKRGRGRPGVNFSEIRNRADNYRWILSEVWDQLWPLLSKARTEQDVISAFEKGASPYHRDFMPALAGLVIKVVHEPKFPKR